MRHIILKYFLVVFLVGLPIWYYTTAVKRADIPQADIRALSLATHSELNISILLVLDGSNVNQYNKELIQLGEAVFTDNLRSTVKMEGGIFTYSTSVSITVKQGEGIASKSITEIDSWLAGLEQREGVNLVVIVGDEKQKNAEEQFILSMSPKACLRTFADLSSPREVIKNTMKKAAQLVSETLFSQNYKVENVVKPAASYHVTFTLLNGDTENTIFTWNFDEIFNKYLKDLFGSLERIAHFSVDSQAVQYAHLGRAKPIYDSANGYYYFTPAALPYFVSANEWKIDSTSMNESTLNFLLYIPSSKVSPLYVRLSDGSLMSTNGWLVPQWGGVVIHNTAISKNQTTDTTATDVQVKELSPTELLPALGTFVSQLRQLLGFNERKYMSKAGVQVVSLAKGKQIATPWEIDAVSRRLTLYNLANAIKTLQSFGQMIASLTNMPIPQSVANDVNQTIGLVNEVRNCLRKGNSDRAFQASLRALTLSEKLFFDKNMLAMLYFPEEHMFAIYVPLFVPVTFPLIMAWLSEIKRRRAKQTTPQQTK